MDLGGAANFNHCLPGYWGTTLSRCSDEDIPCYSILFLFAFSKHFHPAKTSRPMQDLHGELLICQIWNNRRRWQGSFNGYPWQLWQLHWLPVLFSEQGGWWNSNCRTGIAARCHEEYCPPSKLWHPNSFSWPPPRTHRMLEWANRICLWSPNAPTSWCYYPWQSHSSGNTQALCNPLDSRAYRTNQDVSR